ncbi:MAG: DUF302 domain-containing protein [Candidatus Peregrinibacteria bacterium]
MASADSYSFTATLDLPVSLAEEEVRTALKQEKFGIISEIDIAAKLKEKLGIDHPPHMILGACNPALAHQALQGNVDAALALPCNVVLREDKGKTIVTALLPSIALQPFEGLKVQESACTAEEALKRVFDGLRG